MVHKRADEQAAPAAAGEGEEDNLKRLARTTFLTFIFGLLLYCGTGSHRLMAQTPKPLTAADLTQMKTAGFNDQTIINAISANGVSLDTSVQGLVALKQSGLSEKVIDAALAAAAPRPPASSNASANNGLPDDIGVYTQVRDQLTPLPVEVVNFKTAGTLGMAFSYGFKKAKLQGTVPGDKSSAQLTLPVALVLRCPDGTAPTEYQLIALTPKKDVREFTDAKVGVTGASAGVDSQALALNFQKIGHDTYKATIAGLKKGEYGFLAPGTAVSMNTVSTGKMYSFGVSE
ncbi:hypothetical protein [Paracidobacterium acidisoli]|uniref:Uncharacterized protein n=1 Tax=Paracidobacterium acidisoli TaxID=2303751 RepID=A0A372IK73_9BACT|nr:hypothetical protein [Paracidobacterium acidisoli]MBT9332640.1 hypothetical protein [Paracidobacterium acidisoli]